VKSQKQKATQAAYRRAFGAEFNVTWGGTKFANEIENLSYFRSLTCWYGSNEFDTADRRELLYRYAESHFDTEDQYSTLNELYQALPVKSGGKRILRNLCGLYNLAPRRTFGTRKLQDETARTLYGRIGIDNAMKLAHRYARLTNNALIMPKKVGQDVIIDVIPPDLYRVVLNPEDFRQVDELWIPIRRRNGETNFNVWTADTYTVADADGKTISSESNPYKRIPGVFLQLETDVVNYYGGGLIELTEAEIDNNFLKFCIDNNIVYSGFNVWLATNFNLSKVTLSPNKIIAVNKVVLGEGQDVPPTLENISPTENYLALEEVQDKRYQRALREMGLPATLYSPDAKTDSGYSIFMQRQELMEIRKEDESTMRAAEREVYKLLALMQQTDFGVTTMPNVEEFQIDYQEQGIMLEPKEDFELKKAKFEYGILSPMTFVKELAGIDNMATDDEAIQYIQANRTLIQDITTTGQAPEPDVITNTTTQ
jgi:hypothetical protein